MSVRCTTQRSKEWTTKFGKWLICLALGISWGGAFAQVSDSDGPIQDDIYVWDAILVPQETRFPNTESVEFSHRDTAGNHYVSTAYSNGSISLRINSGLPMVLWDDGIRVGHEVYEVHQLDIALLEQGIDFLAQTKNPPPPIFLPPSSPRKPSGGGWGAIIWGATELVCEAVNAYQQSSCASTCSAEGMDSDFKAGFCGMGGSCTCKPKPVEDQQGPSGP